MHQGRFIARGTPDELKAATGQTTLEDVFRKLTNAESADPAISRILSSLRP
jgi:hypothetical protein